MTENVCVAKLRVVTNALSECTTNLKNVIPSEDAACNQHAGFGVRVGASESRDPVFPPLCTPCGITPFAGVILRAALCDLPSPGVILTASLVRDPFDGVILSALPFARSGSMHFLA